MKKNAIFFLFLLPQILLGQTTSVEQQQSRVNNMNKLMEGNTSSLMLYYKPNEVGINGSKFFNEEYAPGVLWFLNGDSASTGYVFKFDETENSVQFKGRDGQEILADPNKITGCKLNIDGKSVIYFKTEVPDNLSVRRMFQLIYSSETYQVIKLPAKKLITKPKIFHDDPERIEYVEQHRYFLKKGNGEFKEFKLKKKELLAAFPAKKALITRLLETPQYKRGLTEGGLAEILMELDKVK
jgi:hypothetical protein